MKRLSCILQNRGRAQTERHRFVWLGAATLLLSSWMANPGMAAPSPVSGAATLDQQLLARSADAPSTEIQKLLERGAHVNAQDRFGVTPLMQAVIGNNVAVVRELLTAGADLNLRNLRGDTALDLARQLGRADIEKLLIAAGKDHGQ